MKKLFTFIQVSEMTGLNQERITTLIQREWISPVESPETLDEEDVARIHLIKELQDDFGANDESIPIILHLLDQLYCLRHQIKELSGKS